MAGKLRIWTSELSLESRMEKGAEGQVQSWGLALDVTRLERA